MLRFWLALLVLLVAACSSDDGGGTKAKPKVKTEIVFEAAAPAGGASISLRAKELTSEHLVLELVGKNITDLYGLAFRMTYDPAVLEPTAITASTAWQGQTTALANAKNPGLWVAVITRQGKVKGIAAQDTVLGTLTLAIKQMKPTTLAFKLDRSRLVDSGGSSPSAVDWVAGALVERPVTGVAAASRLPL